MFIPDVNTVNLGYSDMDEAQNYGYTGGYGYDAPNYRYNPGYRSSSNAILDLSNNVLFPPKIYR